MEILISVVVSAVTGLLKKIAEKVGVDLTQKVVLLIVFAGCYGAAILLKTGLLTQETIEASVAIFLMAVGFYEAIYIRIVKQIVDSISKK